MELTSLLAQGELSTRLNKIPSFFALKRLFWRKTARNKAHGLLIRARILTLHHGGLMPHLFDQTVDQLLLGREVFYRLPWRSLFAGFTDPKSGNASDRADAMRFSINKNRGNVMASCPFDKDLSGDWVTWAEYLA